MYYFAEQWFRFSHFEVSIIPQYQGILQINTVALLDYGKLFASLRISGDRPWMSSGNQKKKSINSSLILQNH